MELPRSTGSTASTIPWVNGSAKQTPPNAHAPIATVTYGFSSSPPVIAARLEPLPSW